MAFSRIHRKISFDLEYAISNGHTNASHMIKIWQIKLYENKGFYSSRRKDMQLKWWKKKSLAQLCNKVLISQGYNKFL